MPIPAFFTSPFSNDYDNLSFKFKEIKAGFLIENVSIVIKSALTLCQKVRNQNTRMNIKRVRKLTQLKFNKFVPLHKTARIC